MVRTNAEKGPLGISAFIIEKDTPGFTVGKLENKFGLRGYPTGELFLDNCRIPKKNMLGKEGEGFKNFQAGSRFHFIGNASVYVGLSQAALDTCVQYAKEKESIPPATLSHLESIQGAVTEMAAEIEASRLLMLKASTLLGVPDFTPLLAVQKCSRMALKVTGDAVALHGGYGCLQENLANRLFRDAKTLSLQISYDKFKSVVGKRLMEVSQ
jgi:alkylation response protein AidB-like acyl-CoA dehydrogenase